MRKILSFAAIFAVIILFSAFKSRSHSTVDYWLADGRYIVYDTSELQDEASLTLYDLQKGGPVGVTFCPGTGYACIVELSPHPGDNDPVYFVSRKGLGKANFDTP